MSTTLPTPPRTRTPHHPESPHPDGSRNRKADQSSARPSRRSLRATRKAEVAASTEGLSVERRWGNVSWWAIGWLTMAHLVVLAAPFTFTWTGLAVALVLHWFTGSLGICLGYHRLLTHDGMKTYPW